jgi:aspartate aminotransferase
MNIDRIQTTPSVALADQARRLKAEGVQVIELQTGDPDFPTPSVIIEAAARAMRAGHTHYSFSAGLPQLRDRLAADLSAEYQVALRRENVLITHGATQGIAAIVNALVELGDEVIILEPNWTTLDSHVRLAGGVVIKVPYMCGDHELLERLQRAKTSRTRIICLNSPNNPTGAVFEPARIAMLVGWAIENGLYVLSDEVYRPFVFDVAHASVMEHFERSDKLLFVDSFSKRYAMTGWRIGFVVGDVSVMTRIAKASQVMITNVAPFVQYGALAALDSKEAAVAAREIQATYHRRRDMLLQSCKREGLEVFRPDGAFYLFLRVSADDAGFAQCLLDEQRVCAVPGSAYGESGRGWLRLTFAASVDLVEEGLRRVAHQLHSLP